MQFVESNHFSTTTTLWRASQSPLPSQVLDSNQRIRFCRPSPNHSANLTLCSSIGIRTPTFSSVVKGAIRYTIEPTITSIEFFDYVSNSYTLLLLQSFHSHVFLLQTMLDDNHNTNYHFVCCKSYNSCRLHSFSLLFLLSFYIRFVYLMFIK